MAATTDTSSRVLLSPKEVEARYGIPVATLAYWRRLGSGGPPSLRVGARVKYRVVEVDEWIARQNDGDQR